MQESELQSRVCQLEQQLHQVESRRNSELQELQDMMASLKKKEQELTSFVDSQAAAQEQQDELKQVVRNCEEKLKRKVLPRHLTYCSQHYKRLLEQLKPIMMTMLMHCMLLAAVLCHLPQKSHSHLGC